MTEEGEPMSCDVELDVPVDALGDSGRMLSYWPGPTDTALYLRSQR